MSAIQETIDYVKEDGEFSDCKEQIELAESAQSEFDALNNYIKQLGVLMPCGHLARYAVNGEDGTQYCCMCLCASVTGTDDPKIQAKIAEIINHE